MPHRCTDARQVARFLSAASSAHAALGGGDAGVGTLTVVAGTDPNSFDIVIDGVTGTATDGGTIDLDFDPAFSTLGTTDGGLPVTLVGTGEAFSAVPSVPASSNMALLFMGIMLTLLAAVVLRKTAMNN